MPKYIYLLYSGVYGCDAIGPFRHEAVVGSYSTEKQAEGAKRRMVYKDDENKESWEYQASLGYPTPCYRVEAVEIDMPAVDEKGE